MPSAFELQLNIDGKRFKDVDAGIRALARGLDPARLGLDRIITRELKDMLDTVADAMAQRHSTPWRPGTRLPTGVRSGKLARRSGATIRAVKKSVKVRGTGRDITGTIGGPFWLVVHEEGATIRAKRARYLTIPLPAALTSRGTPRRRRARDWPNTFVQRSRRGNLIIFQKRGSRIVPLYLLKKRVRIPRRLGLGATLRAAAPVALDRIGEAVVQRIRELRA